EFSIPKPIYEKAHKYKAIDIRIEKCHCPEYRLDIPGIFLPGFAYSWLMPRDDPNEEYYINLLHNAMRMYDMKPESFEKTITQQIRSDTQVLLLNTKRVLEIIAGACSMFAQSQLYIADHVYNGKM